MKTNGIEKLERKVIATAMKRLQRWKRENPKGLVPFGKPQSIVRKDGWNFVKACLDLDAARSKTAR